jgi:hypothetical protein
VIDHHDKKNKTTTYEQNPCRSRFHHAPAGTLRVHPTRRAGTHCGTGFVGDEEYGITGNVDSLGIGQHGRDPELCI